MLVRGEDLDRFARVLCRLLGNGIRELFLNAAASSGKKNILSAPLPDPNDDSADAHRMRSLILAAADSTIEQTIRMQTNLLTPSAADDDIEKIFEERQKRTLLEIERLTDGKPSKPH